MGARSEGWVPGLSSLRDPLHDGGKNPPGGALTGNLIRNPEAIAEILQRACERRELMILVTPYLRFESSFLRMDKGEIHAAATMGREDAMFGLRGFGMCDGRRTLRRAVPEVLQEEDHRGSYRVEHVGRVPVTFSTPKFD